mmetsp:Transcript_22350/g.49744  ORF Transcript_22350/g.49744 Transcript_22350/m.49744 type:complete len:252 (-) Transcript_22350:27-782(-)
MATAQFHTVTIGRYSSFHIDQQYTNPMGDCSYGFVASATTTSSGHKVAINKVKDAFLDVGDATRFLREMKLLHQSDGERSRACHPVAPRAHGPASALPSAPSPARSKARELRRRAAPRPQALRPARQRPLRPCAVRIWPGSGLGVPGAALVLPTRAAAGVRRVRQAGRCVVFAEMLTRQPFFRPSSPSKGCPRRTSCSSSTRSTVHYSTHCRMHNLRYAGPPPFASLSLPGTNPQAIQLLVGMLQFSPTHL